MWLSREAQTHDVASASVTRLVQAVQNGQQAEHALVRVVHNAQLVVHIAKHQDRFVEYRVTDIKGGCSSAWRDHVNAGPSDSKGTLLKLSSPLESVSDVEESTVLLMHLPQHGLAACTLEDANAADSSQPAVLGRSFTWTSPHSPQQQPQKLVFLKDGENLVMLSLSRQPPTAAAGVCGRPLQGADDAVGSDVCRQGGAAASSSSGSGKCALQSVQQPVPHPPACHAALAPVTAGLHHLAGASAAAAAAAGTAAAVTGTSTHAAASGLAATASPSAGAPSMQHTPTAPPVPAAVAAVLGDPLAQVPSLEQLQHMQFAAGQGYIGAGAGGPGVSQHAAGLPATAAVNAATATAGEETAVDEEQDPACMTAKQHDAWLRASASYLDTKQHRKLFYCRTWHGTQATLTSKAHLILMVGLADESRPAGMERTTAWLLNALEGLGGPSVQLQYQGKLVCLQWPRDRSKQAIGQLQDLVKSLVEVQGKWGNVSATVSELRLIDKLRPWCEGNLLSHKWSTYPFAPSKRLLLLTEINNILAGRSSPQLEWPAAVRHWQQQQQQQQQQGLPQHMLPQPQVSQPQQALSPGYWSAGPAGPQGVPSGQQQQQQLGALTSVPATGSGALLQALPGGAQQAGHPQQSSMMSQSLPPLHQGYATAGQGLSEVQNSVSRKRPHPGGHDLLDMSAAGAPGGAAAWPAADQAAAAAAAAAAVGGLQPLPPGLYSDPELAATTGMAAGASSWAAAATFPVQLAAAGGGTPAAAAEAVGPAADMGPCQPNLPAGASDWLGLLEDEGLDLGNGNGTHTFLSDGSDPMQLTGL